MPGQIPEWLDSVGPGWRPLLLDLHRELLAVVPDYRVSQVKEKFGLLRVYLAQEPSPQGPEGTAARRAGGRGERARRIVHAAEERSGTICEACGAPGTPRRGAWIKTLCDSCDSRRPRRGLPVPPAP